LNRFDLHNVKLAEVVSAGAEYHVTITYQFFLPTLPDQPLSGRATDVWTRDVDGQWCKEDEPLVLPFPVGVRAHER
jgi:hypothetical protein